MEATETLRDEIVDLEYQLFDAIKRSDKATVEKLTFEPYYVVGAHGVLREGRKGYAEEISADAYRLKTYAIDRESLSFEQLSDDVAVITYHGHVAYERSGRAQTADSYNCSVWVRSNGGWQRAVHTESRAEG